MLPAQLALASPAAFRAAAHRSFLAAAGEQVVVRAFIIGGHPVEFAFAGTALLAPLTMALAHLEIAPVPNPALRVSIWSGTAPGYEPPLPDWQPATASQPGEVAPEPLSLQAVYDPLTKAMSLFDPAKREALFWVRDAATLPASEMAAPLRTILHWWAADWGAQLLHGGAVGTAQGGVLFAGRSGVGKSTSSLACLAAPESGLRYAGDDYVLLVPPPAVGTPPAIHSLYNSAKLAGDHLHRLPQLAFDRPDGTDYHKALIFSQARWPERLIAHFPLRAVVLPQVVGGPTSRLRSASAVEGLTALAPSTLMQLAGAGPAALRRMRSLMESVPCLTLEMGDDPAQVPPLIAALLAQYD